MKYEDFLARLSNPARTALEVAAIDSFEKLAAMSKKELLSLHGLGPKSLPVIQDCLEQLGLQLRNE